MKYSFIFTIMFIFITGCSDPLEAERTTTKPTKSDKMSELCLNGVSYYYYERGYRGALAVRIDRETLQPKLCELGE